MPFADPAPLPQNGRQVLGPDLNRSESVGCCRPLLVLPPNDITREPVALRDFDPVFVRFTPESRHRDFASICPVSARLISAHGGEIFLGAVGAFAMDSYATRAWGGLPIAPRRLRFSAGPRLPEPHERSCSRGF